MIFVYGSLKRGLDLHHLLQGSRSVGPAVTCPHYRLFNLGDYPGIVEWPEGVEIEGELYEVTVATLATLDHAEGVDEGLYARRSICLVNHAPESAQAWFWLGSISGRPDCGTSW